MTTDPPRTDQFEITLFGPGYGECSVLHLGAGAWMIVDFCVDRATKRPAALQYLEALGVPFTAVKFVVCSHWHDDHCAGMAEVVASCSTAKVCMSSAVTRKEFADAVADLTVAADIVAGSGVSEITATLLGLKRTGRRAVRAAADRMIVHSEGGLMIQTLSPSDAQFERFLVEIAGLAPTMRERRRRFPTQRVNDLSVVVQVNALNVSVLLGADLEICADPGRGWVPILESGGRVREVAGIFKVPHHGSETGHEDRVWSEMLALEPIAIATPYRRGRHPLPRTEDVSRIKSRAGEFFLTSTAAAGSRRRDRTVQKIIDGFGYKVENVEPQLGAVRLRALGPEYQDSWDISFQGSASIM